MPGNRDSEPAGVMVMSPSTNTSPPQTRSSSIVPAQRTGSMSSRMPRSVWTHTDLERPHSGRQEISQGHRRGVAGDRDPTVPDAVEWVGGITQIAAEALAVGRIVRPEVEVVPALQGMRCAARVAAVRPGTIGTDQVHDLAGLVLISGRTFAHFPDEQTLGRDSPIVGMGIPLSELQQQVTYTCPAAR